MTEVGLLSLAGISCLQSMNILHLKRLTPSGLAAALLACGALTKVKVQASFKSLLPKPLFEHLEARGCVFQWREKVLQVCPTIFFFRLGFCSNLMLVVTVCEGNSKTYGLSSNKAMLG